MDEPMWSVTAFDRCDRCMAQAYVKAEKEGDWNSHLLFCLHHTREFKDSLMCNGWILTFDEEHAGVLFPDERASVI